MKEREYSTLDYEEVDTDLQYTKTYRLLGPDFTYRDHDIFFEIVDSAENDDYDIFKLDFDELKFMDSAAIGMLVQLHDVVLDREKDKVIIQNASGEVANTLLAARLDEFYDLENCTPSNEYYKYRI